MDISIDDFFTEINHVNIQDIVDIVPTQYPNIIITIFQQKVKNFEDIKDAIKQLPQVDTFSDRGDKMEVRIVTDGNRDLLRLPKVLYNCLRPQGGFIQIHVFPGSVLESGWLIDIKSCFSQQINERRLLLTKKLKEVLNSNL